MKRHRIYKKLPFILLFKTHHRRKPKISDHVTGYISFYVIVIVYITVRTSDAFQSIVFLFINKVHKHLIMFTTFKTEERCRFSFVLSKYSSSKGMLTLNCFCLTFLKKLFTLDTSCTRCQLLTQFANTYLCRNAKILLTKSYAAWTQTESQGQDSDSSGGHILRCSQPINLRLWRSALIG